MKDILDYIFTHGTRQYIIYQVIFYVLFFVIPFLTQLSLTKANFKGKSDQDYYQEFARYCILLSMFSNCVMYSIEILQMKQSGPIDYFKDDYYNIFDTTNFFIFTAYFFLRMNNPIPMLVGSTDDLDSVKVDSTLMITIMFNVLILIQIVIKVFFYLRVNPQFGL